jgi:hypothetical protein
MIVYVQFLNKYHTQLQKYFIKIFTEDIPYCQDININLSFLYKKEKKRKEIMIGKEWLSLYSSMVNFNTKPLLE